MVYFNGFFEFNNFQNLFWIHVESHVEYQLHKLEKFKFQKLAWGDFNFFTFPTKQAEMSLNNKKRDVS